MHALCLLLVALYQWYSLLAWEVAVLPATSTDVSRRLVSVVEGLEQLAELTILAGLVSCVYLLQCAPLSVTLCDSNMA